MKMVFGDYCRIARELAGFTQQDAEPLLGVSWRSISDYERGFTLTPRNIVIKMMEAYDAKWLGYQYFICSEIGQALNLPVIPIGRNLSSSILNLQVEMDDVIDLQKALARVCKDDVVTEDEHPTFEGCKKELTELVGAAMSIITIQKNKTPVVAHRRGSGVMMSANSQ